MYKNIKTNYSFKERNQFNDNAYMIGKVTSKLSKFTAHFLVINENMVETRAL